jgi:3-oxoisoapionate decarboxylase
MTLWTRTTRRRLLAGLPGLAAARSALAAAGAGPARLGLCTFSCHLHWKAVAAKQPGTKFGDARGFYDYARGLGAEGVQTSLRTGDMSAARDLRSHVEKTGGYFEADIPLPKLDGDLSAFEDAVRLAREAGASVARAVLMGTRRYEVFQTLGQFREFRAAGERRLADVEPLLKKHRLKLALENHKDLLAGELGELLGRISSEWLGALVDTGNNIALMEEPHAVVEALAPFALSVHLKDMAVQEWEQGFLLSEVPCGTGFLDLPRMIATLRKANPALVFNLEMATRDPLRVPCRTEEFWATFPDRRAAALPAALALVREHPPGQPPPRIEGKTAAEQLSEEEVNNRISLEWMRRNIR